MYHTVQDKWLWKKNFFHLKKKEYWGPLCSPPGGDRPPLWKSLLQRALWATTKKQGGEIIFQHNCLSSTVWTVSMFFVTWSLNFQVFRDLWEPTFSNNWICSSINKNNQILLHVYSQSDLRVFTLGSLATMAQIFLLKIIKCSAGNK